MSTGTAIVDDTERGREQEATRFLGLRALGGVIRENLILLLLVPLLVGLITFASTGFLPKWYTSVAYLNVDEAGERSADALMRTPRVLGRVIAAAAELQGTQEARSRLLEAHRRIVAAPGDLQKTSNLFRLEYSDPDPHLAQKINSAFIEAWLEATKPPPTKRAAMEAELIRREARHKLVSQLIDRALKDADRLVSDDHKELLAASIADLIVKNDENAGDIVALKNALDGVSHDLIFTAPDLPEEPSWPKRGIITVLATFAAGLLGLMFVIARWMWRVKR
ncbi:hypothetical protein [Bradyrhizobium sp. CCGUVB14]|uniref:hypothetical protein n=1 Tax=Bradyrhizobium sp. CCGUVB14 TaxID=2949628 RepID=UPI0020B3485F|nr:hypothetical protein [Bradyrhizobium sp. CCGUVB14]MCP3445679.1 hypothetical protein [Bradyrhizobium sp. CCGUVB14]